MNEKEVMKCLAETNAIITDSHFVYTSGRHGSTYINKDAVYPHTDAISKLCKEIARRFQDRDIDIIAGPTVGGVILSQWVAHYLSVFKNRKILSVFAEEDESRNRFFKRGYDKLIEGKNVLIVEDILTTGGSVKKVVDAVKMLGGIVVGVAALCNRGGVKEEDIGGVPFLDALVKIDLESWDEAECPLCREGVPVNTNVGKGKFFVCGAK